MIHYLYALLISFFITISQDIILYKIECIWEFSPIKAAIIDTNSKRKVICLFQWLWLWWVPSIIYWYVILSSLPKPCTTSFVMF